MLILTANGDTQQMEGISDLPTADGLAMLAAVTPAPKQRKKEVKSQRSKDIAHFKTKAFDACGILIEAKWMTDPGDHEGLRAHLECAQELAFQKQWRAKRAESHFFKHPPGEGKARLAALRERVLAREAG